MDKKELRKEYLNIRKRINNKEEKSIRIFNEVINLKEYKENRLILSYVSLNDEVDTIELIKHSLRNGKQVAVPKCEGETINFYYISSIEELKKGTFGVLEPESKNKVTDFKNSICIIPGVAFDKDSNRVGYGKGYYDRFLSTYKGEKIGIIYKECICEKIDIDKYDIKLDKVILG